MSKITDIIKNPASTDPEIYNSMNDLVVAESGIWKHKTLKQSGGLVI